MADNVKQILRAFNNECEAIIDKVKFNNVESIRKRIIKSCEDLNKLNAKMQISIAPSYLDLKLQEMNLCYEYTLKKTRRKKKKQKRIRAEQREIQKLQKGNILVHESVGVGNAGGCGTSNWMVL